MGGATCALILLMDRAGLLAGRSWAVIEPGEKRVDDKTYCFWSEGLDGPLAAFAPFVQNQWDQVIIDGHPARSIAPASYRRIRSISLYDACKHVIEKRGGHRYSSPLATASAPSESWTGPFHLALASGESLQAHRVFDSRPPEFLPGKATDVLMLQSFVGYRIRLDRPRNWNVSAFHMMDFHVPQGDEGATQFMYTLPEGEVSGLVELTRFGQVALSTDEAAGVLDAYIRAHFGPYQVEEVETGGIPMCMAPMQHEALPAHPRWTALGTRAGRVKPSTGYAFKSMVTHAHAICSHLEQAGENDAQQPLPAPISRPRFAFYDRLLLLILRDRPSRGKPIFQRLFSARPAPFVLKFLDEATHPWEEARMFARLPIAPFLQACWWRFKDRHFPWVAALLWLAVVGALWWANGSGDAAQIGGHSLLAVGLFAVGIPHGALDAITGITWGGRSTTAFYARYLSIMAVTLAVWCWAPTFGVTAFIAASVWHFGQTDVAAWNVSRHQPLVAIAWGALTLGFVLGFHLEEVGQILLPIGVNEQALRQLVHHQHAITTTLWAGAGVAGLATLVARKGYLLAALAALALTTQMPLLWAFASYFIFHHSLHGWNHLRRESGWTSRQLWWRGAPFTLGAWLLLVGGGAWAMHAADSASLNWGLLFALLSAISLPHILESHEFLKRSKDG